MRLIDVDKFVFYTPRQSDGEGLFVKWLKEILNKAPTVDAVPVIRCKDCKWHDIKTFRELTLHRCYLNPDDVETCPDGFCAWAERKDNG